MRRIRWALSFAVHSTVLFTGIVLLIGIAAPSSPIADGRPFFEANLFLLVASPFLGFLMGFVVGHANCDAEFWRKLDELARAIRKLGWKLDALLQDFQKEVREMSQARADWFWEGGGQVAADDSLAEGSNAPHAFGSRALPKRDLQGEAGD
jgi:hypothetical protein